MFVFLYLFGHYSTKSLNAYKTFNYSDNSNSLVQLCFEPVNYGSKFGVLGYNSTYNVQTKFKKVKHATPSNK